MAPLCHVWNANEIASDVVDGEAVIIHLTDGTYYSLDRAGTAVWEALATPRRLDAIGAMLAARYAVPVAQAQADVDNLVGAFVRERLVTTTVADEDASPLASAPVTGVPYAPPQLSKYADMADMLALDPPLPGVRDLPWKTPSSE